VGEYEEFFTFAAKVGSLEGYLYEREKVEPLDNWVSNMEKMYANLPDNVKKDIRSELGRVLTRTLTHGGKVLDDEIKSRLNNLLAAL
jgi:hypothetical protein